MTQTIHFNVTSQKSPLATDAEGSVQKSLFLQTLCPAGAIEILQRAFIMWTFYILAAPEWMELKSFTHFYNIPSWTGVHNGV